jgi:hypothetical protein
VERAKFEIAQRLQVWLLLSAFLNGQRRIADNFFSRCAVLDTSADWSSKVERSPRSAPSRLLGVSMLKLLALLENPATRAKELPVRRRGPLLSFVSPSPLIFSL